MHRAVRRQVKLESEETKLPRHEARADDDEPPRPRHGRLRSMAAPRSGCLTTLTADFGAHDLPEIYRTRRGSGAWPTPGALPGVAAHAASHSPARRLAISAELLGRDRKWNQGKRFEATRVKGRGIERAVYWGEDTFEDMPLEIESGGPSRTIASPAGSPSVPAPSANHWRGRSFPWPAELA